MKRITHAILGYEVECFAGDENQRIHDASNDSGSRLRSDGRNSSQPPEVLPTTASEPQELQVCPVCGKTASRHQAKCCDECVSGLNSSAAVESPKPLSSSCDTPNIELEANDDDVNMGTVIDPSGNQLSLEEAFLPGLKHMLPALLCLTEALQTTHGQAYL